MIEIKIKALSVNSCYQGKRFKNQIHRNYTETVLSLLPLRYEPKKAPLQLTLEFGLSSKLQDLDNCLKVFQDCLVKKYGFDDREIYKLIATKTIVKKGSEFIRFEITELI
jgi:Holliday junction resolvase RusA-like endonuclease